MKTRGSIQVEVVLIVAIASVIITVAILIYSYNVKMLEHGKYPNGVELPK